MKEMLEEQAEELLALCEKWGEMTTDGVLLVGRTGRILYMNEAYCEQLGVTRQEAEGRPVEEIVTNTTIPKMMRERDLVPQHNVLWQTNPKQYKSEEKYSIVSRQVVTNSAGEIIGAVGQVKFLSETLQLSAAISNMRDELSYLHREVERLGQSRYSIDNIVGKSQSIMAAKKIIPKAANNDFPVLITGESGTGKELFANAIHYSSRRKGQPIVRVNCAAIPAELFESEMFGYAEGAFTGTKKGGKKGKIQLAHKGTLFLDEIGDMPMTMQTKLLRVLQEQEVEVVGGKEPVPVDIRVIAATNKNLMEEVEKGNFRMDLYYRLDVMEIYVPPLCKRSGDIALLAQNFLHEINRQYETHKYFADTIVENLEKYAWPGNVRELRNAVARAYTLADGDKINLRNFSSVFGKNVETLQLFKGKTFERMKAEYEQELILEALKSCDGNVKKCAEVLQVHRSTLYAKLNEYRRKGIKIDE